MADTNFQSLSSMEFAQQMTEHTPSFHNTINSMFQIWFWGELIVLLFNKRRRAIHDFIAGTVVIKKRALPLIERHIGLSHQVERVVTAGRVCQRT